jgi:tetratricopeptide (TPR) repeat protein
MKRPVLAAALLLSAIGLDRPAAGQPLSGRILVMPFENVSHNSRIVWLGEAASVLVADDLNALGAAAITREERREAFDRLQVPPTASLTDATIIRIGQLVRASQVLVGRLNIAGDDVVVKIRAIGLESAKVQAEVDERGPLTDLFGIFERVARKVAPSPARTSTDLGQNHPPVAAFENYIKGLLAETPATAVSYLEAALKADPTLDRARIALWEVFDEQGENEKALAAAKAIQASSPLWRRARFRAALSSMSLKQYDEAFGTLKALSNERQTAAVLNNLGVIQLRRGGTPSTGFATYYFSNAFEADQSEPDYCFNLGYAYWFDRDPQAAVYWLREAVRRDPTDGDAHYVLGAALAAAGQAAESAREKDLARRLSSAYEEWDKRPANDAVPRGLERVKGDVELPHARQIEQTLASGRSDQQELAAFYLDRARRLVEQESDGDAMAELNRVLFLAPYSADAHMLIGRIHLRAGHAREAIEAFSISIWSAESADAHAWLAEAYALAKDVDSARKSAERAIAMQPAHPKATQVLEGLPPR